MSTPKREHYLAELERFRIAFAKYDAIRKQYRDGKVTDATFLEARAEFQSYQAKLDEAENEVRL